MTDDGRIDIDLDSRLAKTLATLVPRSDGTSSSSSPLVGLARPFSLCLNIVIQVVGSRGDVQPWLLQLGILEAVEPSGVRAIISKGWSKLASPMMVTLEMFSSSMIAHTDGSFNVCRLWSITVVLGLLHAAYVMHAERLWYRYLATDNQPFWGAMVAQAGAGPRPISHRSLTSQNLATAISFRLTAEAKEVAQVIFVKMSNERGIEAAVRAFHASLPLEDMQCAILPPRPAPWAYKDTSI
ncbi:glycosyltransferase family 1 protein [Lophiostoma macrostomum CBS 122681]|uniref:Glycosyltransferase family 1 protein n=1 Tax=Lophiostoma macrostomum CBS 122681 TaxID=1314788 RepID=A0A6A6TKN6_9PLEO|nr:glycosyltransferase family 1 protein [Lophiostoma macrostomum CBS 122681]